MVAEDLKHAVRRLRARPARTVATVAMLAIAVGLTTAVFTVADALVFTPVPFQDAGRLTSVMMWTAHGGFNTVSTAVFRAWRESRAFDAVEGTSSVTSVIDTDLGPFAKPAARVSPGTFAMLGVRPLLGRAFDSTEGRAGSDRLVVLSEDLWRSAFGRDGGIVGRSITIDGERVRVVGVMPASFRFPDWNTALWRPLDYAAPPAALATERPQAIARLARGLPVTDAMRMATDAARTADAQIGPDMQATPLPLAGDAMDRSYWRVLPALAGGVALVFVVLCANVCSLLLAALAARRRELQVCAALGASRLRLFSQVAVEHGVIGLAGATAGVGIAWLLVALARAFLPNAFLLHTLHPVGLDLRAFAAAAAAGFAATMAAGLLPAWIGTRADASLAADVSRTATGSRSARQVTGVLLVTEIALACALLMGATLLLRSFTTMTNAARGVRTEGVLTAWIALPANAFPDRPSRLVASQAVEDSVRSLPSVSAIALSYGVPPGGGVTHYYDNWTGDAPGAQPHAAVVNSYYVGADFFGLYGIPILQGRTFQPGDGFDRTVVSERLAALLWPGHSPVGRQFHFGDRHLVVVGVAREITLPSLDAARDVPEFYQPFQGGGNTFFVNMRCAPQCPGEAAIRRAVAAAVPRSQVQSVKAPETAYSQELARPRALVALATIFGVIAALAVAGGLFSVLTFAVAARQREFGIRAAIGASPRALRSVVYADAARVGAAGLVLGGGAAIAVAYAIRALVYGVTPWDPRSWALVVGVLVATMSIACWRPARTAGSADPVTLLRTE